nr:sporulation inhibitor of replication protein SirA [uncultured Bacillus sp.]
MRTYQIYLIVDEFASHFFGRERVIFHLFQEYEESKGEYKHTLDKQIHFITKPIQKLKISHGLTQSLQTNLNFYKKDGKFYLHTKQHSFAELEIRERCVWVKASGNYEAETAFFEVLRKTESSFLAIDLERQHCAWLKPIKERKFV